MDGDLSALPPSAALPPIDPSSSSSSTSTKPTLPLSAPPFPKTTTNPTSSTPTPTPLIPSTLAKHTSLLSPALHTRILGVSDEFFAPAANLISPTPPVRRPGYYVETGAWYDGWETRRHNTSQDKDGGEGPPCDWVVFALGVKGKVRVVEVDTFGFVGNQGEGVRVLGACLGEKGEGDAGKGGKEGEGEEGEGKEGQGIKWTKEILPKCRLEGDTRYAWLVNPEGTRDGEQDGITHIKLQMFPDGGIARFRLYGDVLPNFPPLASLSPHQQNQAIELSAAINGGVVEAQSDEHFGKAANLLLPGRGRDMGDGWETKRSRGRGHEDWVVVRLGARGRVGRVLVDTMHFRGNFPRSVRVEGVDQGGNGGRVGGEGDLPFRRMQEEEEVALGAEGEGGDDGAGTGMAGEGGFFERDEGVVKNVVEKEEKKEEWKVLGVVEQCEKDKEHEIVIEEGMVCTHAKMVMIPDGGVKRFRVFGTRV